MTTDPTPDDPLTFDEVRRRGLAEHWSDASSDYLLDHDTLLGVPYEPADAIPATTDPEWPTFDLAPVFVRRLQAWATTGRRAWIIHNVIAHPLLVLWPNIGERLHEATEPGDTPGGGDW